MLFPGGPSGLDPVNGEEMVFSQHTDDVLGTEQDGDEFGYSLATGDFDGDGRDDLAMGAPLDNSLVLPIPAKSLWSTAHQPGSRSLATRSST